MEDKNQYEENTDKVGKLLDIWEEICGVRIDPDENFFTTGVDSIALNRFNVRISEISDKDISVTDLFYYTTIAEIAEII